MSAQGGEAWAAGLLLPHSLGENSGAGDVQSLQEGDFTSPGMHRQVTRLNLLLDSLQLLYIKSWVAFLNEH